MKRQTLIDALGLERAHILSLCGAGGKTTLMFALAREFVARGERVLVTTTTKLAWAETTGWPAVSATSLHDLLDESRRVLPARTGARAGALVAYSAVGPDGRKIVGFTPDVVDGVARSREFDRILVEADGSKQRPLKAPAAHEPVIPSSTDAVILVAGLNGLGLPLREGQVFRPEIWSRLTGDQPEAVVTAESLAQVVVHPEGLAKGSPPHARRVLFLNRADTPERQASAREVIELLGASGSPSLTRVVAGWLLPEPQVVDVVALGGSQRRP